jgi:hypothetical protein
MFLQLTENDEAFILQAASLCSARAIGNEQSCVALQNLDEPRRIPKRDAADPDLLGGHDYLEHSMMMTYIECIHRKRPQIPTPSRGLWRKSTGTKLKFRIEDNYEKFCTVKPTTHPQSEFMTT